MTRNRSLFTFFPDFGEFQHVGVPEIEFDGAGVRRWLCECNGIVRGQSPGVRIASRL